MTPSELTPEQKRLEAKLKQLNELPEKERAQMLLQSFIIAASTGDGTKDYKPFFSRTPIAGNSLLQKTLAHIGAKYAGLLLEQRANFLHHHPKTGMHTDAKLEDIETGIEKKMHQLNNDSMAALQALEPQVNGYKNTQGFNAAECMLGSVVKLARERVMQAVSGFRVDTTLEPDDLDVPCIRHRANAMLRDAITPAKAIGQR